VAAATFRVKLQVLAGLLDHVRMGATAKPSSAASIARTVAGGAISVRDAPSIRVSADVRVQTVRVHLIAVTFNQEE
jgi:hypothetical protein